MTIQGFVDFITEPDDRPERTLKTEYETQILRADGWRTWWTFPDLEAARAMKSKIVTRSLQARIVVSRIATERQVIG